MKDPKWDSWLLDFRDRAKIEFKCWRCGKTKTKTTKLRGRDLSEIMVLEELIRSGISPTKAEHICKDGEMVKYMDFNKVIKHETSKQWYKKWEEAVENGYTVEQWENGESYDDFWEDE